MLSASEPGQSIHWAAALRRRTASPRWDSRTSRRPGCSGRRSDQGGVVSEMVGAFAPPPGIRWRNRAFDENRPGRNHSGPCQQHGFELPRRSRVALSRTNNSYFLSQAFPEGSPTHPAYPTGHGTVAGACITVLKFFFDGTFSIPDPVVPSSDGMRFRRYNAPAGEQPLTVNGECISSPTTSASLMEFMPESIGAAIPIRRSSWARRSR